MIEALFEKYSDSLERFGISLTRDRSAAEDAVQETFSKALTHVELLRLIPESKQKSWLFKVLKNCVIDRKRHERFETFVEDMAEFSAEQSAETMSAKTMPADDLISRAGAPEIIASLPAKLRDVIVKKFWLGMTSAEIAHTYGITPGAVRFRLHTALNRLKRQYAADAKVFERTDPACGTQGGYHDA